jgi:hypothetical protein
MAIQNPFTSGTAGLSAVPEEYQPQALQNLQQQRMAQLLMQQGMQNQPQGQMISGRYVAPSPYQNLASIANQALGLYAGYQADKGQLNLAKAIREGDRSAMADYLQMREGRPAEMFPAQAGPMPTGGNIPIQESVAAIPPNRRGADANLAFNPKASSNLQQFAFNKLMADPKEFDLTEGAVRYREMPDGMLKEIAKGGEKTSSDYKDYLIAQKDPINPFRGGFTDYQLMNNRSKAPSVSVNASNKFAGGFGEKASGGAYDMYTAAQNAPQQIENAKRTIELVNSGALTGPTANIGLEAAKIFNVAGANNQDTITKTEQLFSNRGKAMLGSIKQSGLAGSQGLTEGERKFLTQAEGGAITLNAETLKAMAGLEIKMAVANQKKWNAQAGKMDKDILNATGAGPVEVYTGIGTIDASNPLLAPKR